MACAVVALLSLACGGDGEPTARSLLPKLDDLGLEIAEEGRDPFAAPSQDTYRARYVATDGSARAAIVVLFVEPDTATAEANYASLAKLLENPPAEFFGANAEQSETDTLELGDERRSFVTAQADSQGNRVWTDIYRKGKVITVIQVLSSQDADDDALRLSVGEAILDRVK
jgi:hypothetical protein